ncbi:DUF7546 family protein [Haloquadratum walsbyi]|uniref:Uncharacterized protein n=1 Tax=Haloquadratum walsbyi (strain DSM 16854 / JCM 12705 / C23) TaxID=768065 RepID=G0LGR8_HALWC|nr:hypothetical protein [Haloquadratum walsbyi]CCC39620.1 uncharacterized protein Hqrw_1685 [Haloquadratum walsbyi C23]
MSVEKAFRTTQRTQDLVYATLLGNSLICLALGYLLIADITITQPRYTIYGLLWIFVGAIVIWKTNPASADARTRRRATIVAIVYLSILSIVGGVIITTGGNAANALTQSFGIRVATLLPGWGPAPIITTPIGAVVLMPARIVGYLALTYLVYATVIDAARAAISGIVGLLSCVSCSWPVIASVLSGVLGGGSAVAAIAVDFSYDVSTIVFILTIALLYWRPIVGRVGD